MRNAPRIRNKQNVFDLESSLEIQQPLHDQPSSRRQGRQKKGKAAESNQKQTLKVPSQLLESRIEKRKVASLMGGPVVRRSACPLWCHLLVEVELV
jgi:hypothetical protein